MKTVACAKNSHMQQPRQRSTVNCQRSNEKFAGKFFELVNREHRASVRADQGLPRNPIRSARSIQNQFAKIDFQRQLTVDS